MSCKPGVTGSIAGFSIKPLSVELREFRHIINTQIINPPCPVLVTTHGKATKRGFFVLNHTKNKKAVTADLKEQSDLALPTALVICQETRDSCFKTEI